MFHPLPDGLEEMTYKDLAKKWLEKIGNNGLADAQNLKWTAVMSFATWLDENGKERLGQKIDIKLEMPRKEDKPVSITPSDSDFHAKARGDKPVCEHGNDNGCLACYNDRGCDHGEHTCKPCCDVCRGFCADGLCPCHKPCEHEWTFTCGGGGSGDFSFTTYVCTKCGSQKTEKHQPKHEPVEGNEWALCELCKCPWKFHHSAEGVMVPTLFCPQNRFEKVQSQD